MVSFPYHSHIFRDSYGSGMGIGIVWEAYHKGVPLLGVPENPIEIGQKTARPSSSRIESRCLDDAFCGGRHQVFKTIATMQQLLQRR